MLPEIERIGVATIAVVNSPLDRARLYFRHRPTPLVLASDPERTSHRAYGVPATFSALHGLTPEQRDAMFFGPDALRFDLGGELDRPLPLAEARHELNTRDGYTLTLEEEQVRAAGAGLEVFFLIDRGGVIRWRWVEALEDPRDLFTFPNASDVLAAAAAAAQVR